MTDIIDNTLENTTSTNEGSEQKTYTAEEVAKLVQSEADKRVTQALATQAKKFEKQTTEAEKLRNMSEEQQQKYKLEQRIQELEEQNRKFELAENKASLAKALSERGLPITFVDYLATDNAEEMMEGVNAFEQAWKTALNDAVSARLATGNVVKGGTAKQTGLTKEEFKKMSLAQKSELYETNRKLYEELSKR